MATTPNVSKPPTDEAYDQLMQRASASTSNLAWLQDYLLDWQTLRSVAIRIANKQMQQTSKDEEAYMALLELIELAGRKQDQLQEAYTVRYSQHERIMIRLENARND